MSSISSGLWLPHRQPSASGNLDVVIDGFGQAGSRRQQAAMALRVAPDAILMDRISRAAQEDWEARGVAWSPVLDRLDEMGWLPQAMWTAAWDRIAPIVATGDYADIDVLMRSHSSRLLAHVAATAPLSDRAVLERLLLNRPLVGHVLLGRGDMTEPMLRKMASWAVEHLSFGQPDDQVCASDLLVQLAAIGCLGEASDRLGLMARGKYQGARRALARIPGVMTEAGLCEWVCSLSLGETLGGSYEMHPAWSSTLTAETKRAQSRMEAQPPLTLALLITQSRELLLWSDAASVARMVNRLDGRDVDDLTDICDILTAAPEVEGLLAWPEEVWTELCAQPETASELRQLAILRSGSAPPLTRVPIIALHDESRPLNHTTQKRAARR